MTEALSKLDRRYLQIALAVIMALPFFVAVEFPMTISPETQKGFDFIQKLPEGSLILISYDASAAGMAEVHPQFNAMLEYSIKRHFRILVVTVWPEGPMLIEWGFRDTDVFNRLQYGKDFVNLGFIGGSGTGAVPAFAKDIHAMIKVDYYGNKLETLPMMESINTAKEIALIYEPCVGGGFTDWLMYVQGVYKTPLYAAVTAWAAPTAMPYLASGQIVGLNNGLKGAAEFEKLVGARGFGLGGITSLSMAHLWAVIVIVVGNIVYFATRGKGGK